MTGLVHGSLSGQDPSKLTGLSVLLPREGWWPYQDRSPVTFKKLDGSLIELHERPDESFFADRFDYAGEWSDDTRTVILAPEGGWKSNPVPGRRVNVYFSDGQLLDQDSHDLFEALHDIVAFSLIEDSKPENPDDPFAPENARDWPAAPSPDTGKMGGEDSYGDETASQIVRRWADWINDVSADMDQTEWGGKTHNDVLNERDFLLKALSAPVRAALPDLKPVIRWLENGCDQAHAATELRIHQKRIDAALGEA